MASRETLSDCVRGGAARAGSAAWLGGVQRRILEEEEGRKALHTTTPGRQRQGRVEAGPEAL